MAYGGVRRRRRPRAAASRLILIVGDILYQSAPGPRARPSRTTPKRNRIVSSRAPNAHEKRAETPRRRRHPIELGLRRRPANQTQPPGRARARDRALVSLRLFIYCCAKQRARRACDACVVRSYEHGVRRGLSVDRERNQRLLGGLASGEGGVTGARHEPAAAAGAAAAAAAAGPGAAGLAADDAPLAAGADGGGAPPRPAAVRQPAAHIHLRPFGQRV